MKSWHQCVFPAKIWIFKFFFLMVFVIKMLLDNTYGLPNLFEFKSNHFNSLFKAEYESKNSNFGGKYIDVKISCWFWNWIAFSILYDLAKIWLVDAMLVFICDQNWSPQGSSTFAKEICWHDFCPLANLSRYFGSRQKCHQ